MAQSKLVLVTGATGKQGGACVEALLTRGHQVRALTRNSASPAANRLCVKKLAPVIRAIADWGESNIRNSREQGRTIST